MSGLFGNANDPRDRRHPMMNQAWPGKNYPMNFSAQVYYLGDTAMGPSWGISAPQSRIKLCKNCKTMPRLQGNSKYYLWTSSEEVETAMCKSCEGRPRAYNSEDCSSACAQEWRGQVASSFGRPRFQPVEDYAYDSRSYGPTSNRQDSEASIDSCMGSNGPLCDDWFDDDDVDEEDLSFDEVYQTSYRKCLMCDAEVEDRYCSTQHAKLAVTVGKVAGCALCRDYPVNPPHNYCSRQCGVADVRRYEEGMASPKVRRQLPDWQQSPPHSSQVYM